MNDTSQERVIFSVDDPHDLNTYQKALHQLDVLRVTVMSGGVTMLIGSYKSKLEPSFMVLSSDWYNHIKPKMKDFIKKQDCVLVVPGDVRQPAVLEYTLGPCGGNPQGGVMREELGPMEQGVGWDGWSYVIETAKFFNCDKPD